MCLLLEQILSIYLIGMICLLPVWLSTHEISTSGRKKKVDEELRLGFGYMRPFLKPANIGSFCYQLVRCWFSCIYCSVQARS